MFTKKQTFLSVIKSNVHQNEDELLQSSDKNAFFTMSCHSLGKNSIKS